MTSIEELIGKIEKNQKKSSNKNPEISQKNENKNENKNDKIKKRNSSKKELKKPLKKSEISEKSKKETSQKKKKKSPAKKRFFVTQVCMSKKSCGEKYAPYVWERLCNDYDQDPNCDSFEIQGFRFEKSPCQGACKKAANIRMKEVNAEKHTQFSYLTPIKASKLIKMIKSGASPDNIKRI